MFITGVELVTGIPGSGKSFFMVERLLSWILVEKRPVYTNLPLIERTLKKYLEIKGGKECAGLIYNLTEERFNKFIEAFGLRQKVIENSILEGTSRSEAIRKWEDDNEGYLDWWIPAGSVIAIDEAHHWYPNPALKSVIKREPEFLMTFLTMHRHGQYLLVIATQAERQLSNTIKSLCSTRYVVKRWDREPLIAGISLEFIGFPILRYEKYQGEDDPERTKPLQIFTRFPKLFMYQYIFRLYESFTHSGGRNEANIEVLKKREEAGIKEVEKVPKNNYIKRVTKTIFKWSFRLFILIGISVMFYKCGTHRSDIVTPKNVELFTVSGISGNTVYLKSGHELKVGAMYKTVTLVLIDPRGVAYFENRDGEAYGLQVGQTYIDK